MLEDDGYSRDISTHAPLAGRDLESCKISALIDDFNPRAPCGARPESSRIAVEEFHISTYAPLAGRDRSKVLRFYPYRDFNPRAPCGARLCFSVKGGGEVNNFNPRAPCGARRRARWYTIPKSVFQPTRPLRGATSLVASGSVSIIFQPTRPLRGATVQTLLVAGSGLISTHAPLAGRDKIRICSRLLSFKFQPTRPLRGATDDLLADAVPNEISTHAPLAGRDNSRMVVTSELIDFNPRAPCGARQGAE